jgi:branched-chain amino acid transport system substrate-binding protein
MTASTMRLGHQDFNKMAFHFFPNPYMSMRSEARVIAQKYPNVTKWVSVGPDVEYGHIGWSAFAGGLKEFYPKYNNKQVKLLEPVWTKFGSNDFKAAVSAVMFSEAEGIYTTLTGADLATFLTQGKAQGLYDKIKVYGDIFNDVQTGKTMGRNNPSNYWTGTTWYPEAPNSSALSKRTYADYKAKLPNQEPLGLLNCGYGALKGIVAGMRAAKSVDPVVVAAAMENLKFETPGGINYFRKEDHQNVLPLGVVRMGPTDPGKAPVVEYVSVDTAEAIEPPSPGKDFPFPAPAVG